MSTRLLVPGTLAAVLITTASIGLRSANVAEARAGGVSEYLEAAPGVSLLVPIELGGQYRWLGPSLRSTSPEGLTTSWTSHFMPVPDSSTPVVALCNEQRGTSECTAEPGDVVRTLGLDRVVIRFNDQSQADESIRSYWRQVPLVPAQDADWVR